VEEKGKHDLAFGNKGISEKEVLEIDQVGKICLGMTICFGKRPLKWSKRS